MAPFFPATMSLSTCSAHAVAAAFVVNVADFDMPLRRTSAVYVVPLLRIVAILSHSCRKSVAHDSAFSRRLQGLQGYSSATKKPLNGIKWLICKEFYYNNWCPEEDSNLHTLRHTDLNRARLPIPPSGQAMILAEGAHFNCMRKICQ